LPHVDFVVNTDGEFGDGQGPEDFRKLVCRLVELARREYVVTSGAKYADIDVVASVAAYSELLRLLGKNARAVITAPFNETVPSTVRSWNLPVEKSFEADSENVRFVLADISDPNYVESFVDVNRVVQVFDHHVGMEDFWDNRLEGASGIEPVGACATLIWERFKSYGKDNQISTTVANLLYTAIYSNTLALNSSVTTERDKTALDELSRYVKLPDDWGSQYYREIEENIVRDVVGAVSNDTKRLGIGGENYVIAQLEVWDAGRLLSDPDFIEKIKAGMGVDDLVDERWFLNLVSIGEGRSYIITSSDVTQAKLGSAISADFSSGGAVGVTDQLFLRKQIIPLLV
jgi:inorganic pyrophosphatase